MPALWYFCWYSTASSPFSHAAPAPDKKSGALSSGAIAGIVIGCLALLGLGAVAYSRSQEQQQRAGYAKSDLAVRLELEGAGDDL